MKEQMLLDRDSFRKAVFERDGYKCLVCGNSDVLTAHHILERRLFDDGGYYLSNGVSLCDKDGSGFGGCHLKAEQTLISCDHLRNLAGIKTIILPEHLYPDCSYDKWANIIHADGTRTIGELFNDESVQKVLKAGGVLLLFRKYVKYPRTYHLNFSPGVTDTDRVLPSTSVFEDREVVITEKYDGENCTLYSDYIHARSIDGDDHPSRTWVKRLQAEIGWNIPPQFRICGENVFALHSIAYTDLPSYFLVFSIWNEYNVALSWDDTLEYAQLLGLHTVPVIYRGTWNEAYVRALADKIDTTKQEGFVVRLTDSFPYGRFRKSVAKWVRVGHVETTHNWKSRVVVKNGLRSSLWHQQSEIALS